MDYMKTALLLLLGVFLVSCAAGPVMKAKTETEAIKSSYSDPDLSRLDRKYRALLQDLYARFTRANVDIYPEGIGFVSLRDRAGKSYHYLHVQVRPRDISFDGNTTKARERFSSVMQKNFPAQLRFIKGDDVNKEGISGLAFAVFWPVRDYSQCDTYGGFVEYAQVYMQKRDVLDILEGATTFLDVAEGSEVIASLDLAPAIGIKVREK